MEETKRIKKEKLSMKVITSATISGLVKATNNEEIQKGDIVTILKGDSQYHLIYYK